MSLFLNLTKSLQFFRPFYFLFLLFLTIPFGGKLIPPLIILLVVSSFFRFNKEAWLQKFVNGKHFYFPLLALFLINIIGFFWSDNISNAFKTLEHLLSFLVFPLILPIYNLSKKQILSLFKVFVFSCFAIALLSFLYFIYISITTNQYIILGEISEGDRQGTVYEYLSKHFIVVNVHRTYFSAYLTISIAFIAYYFKEYSNIFGKNIKWFGGLSLMILFFALICIQSKMALGVFIVIFVFFVRKKVTSNKNRFVIVISVFLLFFITKDIIGDRIKPMVDEIGNIMSPGNDKEKRYAKELQPGSAETRYMLYKSSLQLISQAPMLGYGTGDVKDMLRVQNEKNEFFSISHLNYDPHSQILYMLISYGIVGFFVLIVVFFFPIFAIYKIENYFAVTVLFIILLNCLTESFLIRQEGIVPTALFIAVFSFLNKKTTH